MAVLRYVTLVAIAGGVLTLEQLRRPITGGVGLRLWRLLDQLQVVLDCWARA
jgi:hypothetical protein